MSRWFRFYEGALDDPKVQGLPAELFKVWVNLLCVAARNNGKLPEADLAFMLRTDEKKASKIIDDLLVHGLLDRDGDSLEPHNWALRQYKSDVSNERVKRHRQRHGNAACNVTETANATPPDTEQIQTRTESEKEIPSGRDAPQNVPRETNPPSADHPAWWPQRDRYGRITSDVTDKTAYDVGKAVLGRSAGGQVTKLRKLYHGDLRAVTDLLMQAEDKADATEWIAGVIRKADQGEPIHPKHEVYPESVYRA